MRVNPCRSVTPEFAMSAAPTADMLYGMSDTVSLRRVAVTTISSISAAFAGCACSDAAPANMAETHCESRAYA